MSLPYLGLLEWLAANTEADKAAVWHNYNPMPVKPFQMFYGKPYKPKIILMFLDSFLLCAIALQRHAWQANHYPLEPDIKKFWKSPLGEIYSLWFKFAGFIRNFDNNVSVLIWRLGFEKRLFIKSSFPGRR